MRRPWGTINYVFDPQTSYHTRTYTVNSDVSYGYDQLGRLQTVTVTKQNGTTLGTPLVTTYYYTSVGTLDHVIYPNGTETDYGYDTLNRLTSVTNKRGSTLLSNYVYTLEADGLRTGVTEQELESDSTYSTVTKTWTYDALQRLTQEAYTTTISPTTNNYTDQYVYDLVGNRLSKTHISGGQTLVASDQYNANDQLTTETGTLNGASNYSTTYGYDANGSLTSVSRTGTNAESDTYGYDLQNRLLSANISRTESGQSVTIAASYTYDDSGPRTQGVVTTTIGGGSPSTTTTQYLVDPNNSTAYSQVLEEHTNGSATPSMSYLLGLSEYGQTNGSGVTNYLMPDGQGSTRLFLDALGNILTRYGYDAFGNLLGPTPGVLSLPATSLLYTGQQFDPRLQAYYLRARILDPTTGRFTSRDPLFGNTGLPPSLQKYMYSLQNPTNLADPSGMAPFWAGLGTAVHKGIYDLYENDPANFGHLTYFGKSIPGTAGLILPDIVDYTPFVKQIGEIKPLSPYGLLTGPIQLTAYLAIANGKVITYNGRTWYPVPWLGGGWTPSTWAVGVRPVLPGMYDKDYRGWVAFTLVNAGGIILYKAFRVPAVELAYAFAYAYATAMADVLAAYLASMQVASSDLPTLGYIVDYVIYALIGLSLAGGLIQSGIYISANYAALREGISSLLSGFFAGFALGGGVV